MPYLGDYLGQILSEIVMARAHADLETIRVAELYASHPYLKHFPIPHLRLPTITLDLPYVVEQSEEMPTEGSPRGNIDVETMAKNFKALLKITMARHNIALDKKALEKIDASIDEIMQKLKIPRGGAVALRSAAAAMSDAVTSTLEEVIAKPSKKKAINIGAFAEELKEAAYTNFLSLRELPPRLMVLVTKKHLMEIKDPDQLSRLRLTIAEEGQEWTIIEVDGKTKERLIPE